MKIKLTLLYFLLLVTFSAIANYNLPKEKLKKVKLHLNNKTFELCVPKGYMLSINYTTEEIEYLFRYQDSSCIYLSGFFYCKNERNINLLGDSIYNLRFRLPKPYISLFLFSAWIIIFFKSSVGITSLLIVNIFCNSEIIL